MNADEVAETIDENLREVDDLVGDVHRFRSDAHRGARLIVQMRDGSQFEVQVRQTAEPALRPEAQRGDAPLRGQTNDVRVRIVKRRGGRVVEGVIRGYDGIADLWPVEAVDGTVDYASVMDTIEEWEVVS